MTFWRPLGTEVRMASARETTREVVHSSDDAHSSARDKLVDLVIHRAFYPVLMADRAGPDRMMVKRIQAATRAEIDRFRGYGSAEEVIDGFGRGFNSKPDQDIHSELKLLRLPVINDVRDDFERKARELGFDPDNMLAPFGLNSDTNM